MNRPADYNWAAEVMAYAMAHPAGVARRRAPKASRPVRSAPAAVQAPKAEPAPEPLAVEAPAAMAEPVEAEPVPAEPVSQVVQLRPAGQFTPQDLAAAVECLRLIDREAEDATEYFLGHLPEFYAVGTTVAKPDCTMPDFEHFIADIRAKMVDFPTASHFRKAMAEIVTAGREYQRQNKAGKGEAELAAEFARWARFDRGTYTAPDVASFARAVDGIAGGETLGVYVEGSDLPIRIRFDRLKKLLACRKTWLTWSVRIDPTGLVVAWTGRHGNKGYVRLIDSVNAPTVAVSVGQANDIAKAA